MRNVNERNADLLLQVFEFQLHGLAQFQVKCPQRFIKQEHSWLVD